MWREGYLSAGKFEFAAFCVFWVWYINWICSYSHGFDGKNAWSVSVVEVCSWEMVMFSWNMIAKCYVDGEW